LLPCRNSYSTSLPTCKDALYRCWIDYDAEFALYSIQFQSNKPNPVQGWQRPSASPVHYLIYMQVSTSARRCSIPPDTAVQRPVRGGLYAEALTRPQLDTIPSIPAALATCCPNTDVLAGLLRKLLQHLPPQVRYTRFADASSFMPGADPAILIETPVQVMDTRT